LITILSKPLKLNYFDLFKIRMMCWRWARDLERTIFLCSSRDDSTS